MKGDDVRFQDESEQIVDSRFLYAKYFYRTMYYVLYHNETLAKENYNLYLSTSYAAKNPNKVKELELLLKVLSLRRTGKKRRGGRGAGGSKKRSYA